MKINPAWATIIAFVLTVIAGPFVISGLRKLKVGQTVREEGPRAHQKKNGTPTMGGILIIGTVVLSCLGYMREYSHIFPVLLLMVGFGLVGFLDDYIKVVLRRSLGLKPIEKLLGQIVVTTVFIYFVYQHTDISTNLLIPGMNRDVYLSLGKFNIPMMYFVIIGTANGVNLTDGLDGLASSVTVLAATFFAVITLGTGSGVGVVACAVIGSLLGFLIFNVSPASVFMGDTGSLALGGFVAAAAYMTGTPLFLPMIGFVYVIEVCSVILQVMWFKITSGKRLFKMAPLHHHMELSGFTETKIVMVFAVITAVMSLISLMLFRMA